MSKYTEDSMTRWQRDWQEFHNNMVLFDPEWKDEWIGQSMYFQMHDDLKEMNEM